MRHTEIKWWSPGRQTELGWPPRKEKQTDGNWTNYTDCWRRLTDLLDKNGLDFNSFGRVLDFGCGYGRLIQCMDFHQQEVWGVDIDKERVMWCKEKLHPDLNFLRVQSTHLPFKDDYFDFILCYNVFTEIGEDYLDWLLELRRLSNIMFVTIYDESTIFNLNTLPDDIERARDSLRFYWHENFRMIHNYNKTFYRAYNFKEQMEKYFKIIEYVPDMWEGQTGVLLTG